MEVLVFSKSFHEDRVFGELGHDPQLDLGIIRHDQLMVRGSDETTPEKRIRGDLLKIRVRTGKSSRISPDLHVIGVNPTGLGIDFRQ